MAAYREHATTMTAPAGAARSGQSGSLLRSQLSVHQASEGRTRLRMPPARGAHGDGDGGRAGAGTAVHGALNAEESGRCSATDLATHTPTQAPPSSAPTARGRPRVLDAVLATLNNLLLDAALWDGKLPG
ncbi:unnamed protein product [Miscanthus lutarioriparius]|uniref:Uncharacterized protein n=1 Tax=Miscanthus lutarioriparius TaxID=422564 RepID=A0A811SDF4_9POAL|nr:unnamed protein product [Miscanthus lutarioriparius]